MANKIPLRATNESTEKAQTFSIPVQKLDNHFSSLAAFGGTVLTWHATIPSHQKILLYYAKHECTTTGNSRFNIRSGFPCSFGAFKQKLGSRRFIFHFKFFFKEAVSISFSLRHQRLF